MPLPSEYLTEIPSDIVANVRGLLPHRAALVRFIQWRKREEQALADARQNRDTLAAELVECEAIVSRVDETINTDTSGLVDAIKRGAAWSLRSLSGKGRSDLEGQRVVATHRTEVGRKAIKALDQEIAKLDAETAVIANRQALYVNAALLEYAEAEYGPRYRKAIDDLYAAVAALETVESLAGRGHDGRLVIDLPGFKSAGHEADVEPLVFLPTAMRSASATWQSLARAWATNPRADPSKKLQFAPRDPNEQDVTPYESRSDSERHVIDIRNAKRSFS